MQKLKHILKILFKPAYILLAVLTIIILGFIGLICLEEYRVLTMESIHQQEKEYTIGSAQLKAVIYTLQDVLNGSEQLNNVNTNEFLNLFLIKKTLFEKIQESDYTFAGRIEKFRENSKYLYLNPDIVLWSQLMDQKKDFKKNEITNIALILCDPNRIFQGKYPAATFSGGPDRVYFVPIEWIAPNAEAQKELEAYDRSLSEAGAK